MKKIWTAVGIISLLPFFLSGQGCSDAGFCTAGTMAGHSPLGKKQPVATFEWYSGLAVGEDNVLITDHYLQWQAYLENGASFQLRMPYRTISGGLGQINSLSDPIAIVSYPIPLDYVIKWEFNLGVRIPINDANLQNDEGLVLPMVYQPSLGTYDLMFGFSVQYANFVGAIGYQHPFGMNKNTFTSSSLQGDGFQFWDTRFFVRQPDLIIRLQQGFDLHKKLNISGGVLPIIHLGNDTWLNHQGEREEILGSAGITLNLNFGAVYKFNQRQSIEFRSGFPVLTRKSRPDGLTRFFVAGLVYRQRFFD